MAVNQAEWGTTDPSIGDHVYDEDTVVTITANPASSYWFVNWTGDVANPNSASTTVTMNGNKTVTANFEVISQYSLTMAVNPVGGGTTNPSIGNNEYDENTLVYISATPATNYRFVNWTGDVEDPNSASTTVTMDSDKTVAANFTYEAPPPDPQPPPPDQPPSTRCTLTMGVNQSGWGTTSPSVTYSYNKNTVVTISATPAGGYRFVNWTGDVADSTSSSTIVTMDSNKTVIANFAEIQYTLLTIAVNQSGWGTTAPAVGEYTYDEGTELTITATPADGYRFVNWTGEVADANSSSTTVTMTGDKTVTANFNFVVIPRYTLTMAVNPVDGGTTNPGVGSSHTYNSIQL